MPIIAIDAMGGDYAPEAIVRAILLAVKRGVSAAFILVGDAAAINLHLPKNYDRNKILIVHADDKIGMDEEVKRSTLKRSSSSMYIAIQLVKDGEADAVVSCGNTAAYVALARYILKMIKGMRRPALAAIIPGGKIFLDVGANVDSFPDHLAAWAIAGSIYAREALQKENPLVSLLSIGSEPTKGDKLTKATRAALSEMSNAGKLNFSSVNLESDQLFSSLNKTDVILADGFSGNTTLKAIEGVSEKLRSTVRQLLKNPLIWPLAVPALPLLLILYAYISKTFDYTEYNGAPILGVNGICIKGHGRSDDKAVCNAIGAAIRAVEANFIELLESSFQTMSSDTVEAADPREEA